MNNDIYVCGTYFHVFITLIKVLKSNNKISIVLESTIPEYEKIYKKIKESKLFEKVYKVNIEPISKKYIEDKIETIPFRTNQMIKLFEQYCNIDFSKYDNIYLYNDWTIIGSYLMDKKMYFHLIEDAQDTFILRNDLPIKLYTDPSLKYKVKRLIKRMLHMGYNYIGQSKYIIDIEVNNKEGVNLKNKVLKEVKKSDLYNSLTTKDKKIIYNIFIDKDIKIDKEKKNILILTQPLYIDNLVASQEIQNRIYLDIIKDYPNYNIYIKPHPRDLTDYKKLDSKINIISKNMPMEVLNFNKNLKFDKAITIQSSSINFLEFVDEKIKLGYKILEKYKEK